MPPRIKRAFLVLSLCYWLAVSAEMGAGTVYAVRQGWLAVPFAMGEISVMIVEETSERSKLTTGQLDVISSHSPGSFLDWIKTHGEPGGAFRLVDKDDSMSQDDPKWQALFASKGATTPWLVVGRNGHVLLSEAMPATEDEFMRAVKRYGGQ